MPSLGGPYDPKCPVAKPATPDTFDEALTKAGLDRCTIGYAPKDWSMFGASLAKDPYRLPWYDEVHDHAMRVPGFGRALDGSLDAAADSNAPVSGALQVAAFALGNTEAPCVTPFELDPDQPLARAVAKIIRDAGGEADDAALEADAADVPVPLQRAIAQVVLAAQEADATWTALTKDFTAAELTELGRVPWLSIPAKPGTLLPKVTDAKTQALLSKRFDEAALARGAMTLALRIEQAALASFAGQAGFAFEQATPLGRIIVADAAPHTHADGDHVLLLVDTGGDDTYLFPAGGVDGTIATKDKRTYHVGLAIDLAGKDAYRYEPKPDEQDGKLLPSDGAGRLHSTYPRDQDNGPISYSEVMRQGAARLGYGMLFDLGAEADTYRSLRLSQGYGAAGVGVLYDAGGDDLYEGEAGVQGAAHFGIGLLVDAKGNDTYKSFSQTQGFAFVRAVGMLYDGAGNDQYLVDNGDPADGGDPLYWTIQIPGKANNSFAQGAAWGRRAAGTQADSAYMSGGLGVLRDRHGDDVYEASVQAQASGYWFGTGVLSDGDGNDTYDARYYVQGAGAHFAMALFNEGAGDDKYNSKLVPKATSIGVGHDYTVAWHLDLGGDDVYRGPLLSIGAGNANGIGILVNAGGNDVYRSAAEPTIGCGNLSSEVNTSLPRRAAPTTGIFVDVGGTDTYEVTTPSNIVRGDDLVWQNEREPPSDSLPPANEFGAGADRNSGTVSFP